MSPQSIYTSSNLFQFWRKKNRIQINIRATILFSLLIDNHQLSLRDKSSLFTHFSIHLILFHKKKNALRKILMNCLVPNLMGTIYLYFPWSLLSTYNFLPWCLWFNTLTLLLISIYFLLYNLCCQLLFFYYSPKWWSSYSVCDLWTTFFTPLHLIRNLNFSVVLAWISILQLTS